MLPLFQLRKPPHRRQRAVAPSASPPPPPPPPVYCHVVSVTSPDGDICNVQFDQPIVWDGTSGSFDVPGAPGQSMWGAQLDDHTLQTYGTQGVAGQSWQWDAPDPSITPTPDPSQTGTVS